MTASGQNHLVTLREQGFYELGGRDTPAGSGRPIAVNVDPAESGDDFIHGFSDDVLRGDLGWNSEERRMLEVALADAPGNAGNGCAGFQESLGDVHSKSTICSGHERDFIF